MKENIAAQIIISLVPIVGITLAAVLIFFALLWRHRETKLRIQKGTYSPIKFNLSAFSLLLGLVLVGIGSVLSILFFLITGVTWGLMSGLLPLGVGISLLIYYNINKKNKSKDQPKDNEN